jgi:hypothetical protein
MIGLALGAASSSIRKAGIGAAGAEAACGLAAVLIQSSAGCVAGAAPNGAAAGAGIGLVGAAGFTVGAPTGTGASGGACGAAGADTGLGRAAGRRPPGLGRMMVRSPRPNGLNRPSSLIAGLP